MTHKLWRQGMKIVEVPIIFTDRFQGCSKMSRSIMIEAFFMVWRLLAQNKFRRRPTKTMPPVNPPLDPDDVPGVSNPSTRLQTNQ
jgi:hypothetical protein